MKIAIALIVLISVALEGCGTSVKIPDIQIAPDGFSAFSSARDFDAPGQVYRVTDTGQIYKVSRLKVDIDSGDEALQSYRSQSIVTMEGLAKSLQIPANKFEFLGENELSRERSILIESQGTHREYIQDDSGIYDHIYALFRRVPIRENNKYFVIRETISAKSLVYETNSDWVVKLGISALIAEVSEGREDLQLSNNKSFSLKKNFDMPMRVWYKVEEIDIYDGQGLEGQASLTFELVETQPGQFEPPASSIENP